MQKGIKKKLKKAIENADREIRINTDSADKFSRGLASEGYAGGYKQALTDVLLALNGINPSNRFWPDDE